MQDQTIIFAWVAFGLIAILFMREVVSWYFKTSNIETELIRIRRLLEDMKE